MKKRELLKLLENVPDDNEIFVISNHYDHDDDSTWMADTQTEIKAVEFDGCDAYIRLEVGEFM